MLQCTAPQCTREHYPRTDPAIIVLVEHGDEALFGRKSEWPEKRYSTIAGFVEPGESAEQAVIREYRLKALVIIHRNRGRSQVR
jgi:NAD+ diphosphatase